MTNENKMIFLLSQILSKVEALSKQQQSGIAGRPQKEKVKPLRDAGYVKELLNISDTTFWRRVKSGIFDPSRIGGRSYFTDEDITRYIMENRRSQQQQQKRPREQRSRRPEMGTRDKKSSRSAEAGK